jgi:hypothetical protein
MAYRVNYARATHTADIGVIERTRERIGGSACNGNSGTLNMPAAAQFLGMLEPRQAGQDLKLGTAVTASGFPSC